MRWDCGALIKNKKRKLSSVFRFITENPPDYRTWPKRIKKEVGIFLATPGVSWKWIELNLKIDKKLMMTIWTQTKEYHHLGVKNMMTATLDDALMYMAWSIPYMRIPYWVIPFIMDDFKRGMIAADIARRWNICYKTATNLRNHKQGVIGNVFHNSYQH